MSTNRKNRMDKVVIRNQISSRKIPIRDLLTCTWKYREPRLSEIVDEINAALQLLNRRIPTRNVPYIRISEKKELRTVDRARVLFRSELSSLDDLMQVANARDDIDSRNTYLVELYLNSNGYIEIFSGTATISESREPDFDGIVLIDSEYVDCVLIDIFLDSQMFNSYSFLKSLSDSEKREFNKKKVAFLQNKFGKFSEMKEAFYQFQNDQYKYLSLAFFARKDENEIDLDLLIELWNELVAKYYPHGKHSEPSPAEQVQALVNIKQYDNRLYERLAELKPGGYWLMRVNKKCPPEKVDWVQSIIGSAELGAYRIIPFDSLDAIYPLVEDLILTAFKIVVTE